MSGSAEWKPKLRWLIRRILAVEAFEAAVGEAEADGGEDAVAVAAEGAREPDERAQPGAGGPGQPGVEVRGRERAGRRGGRAAGALRAAGRRGRARWLAWLDLAERGELADGLVLGRLEQRPAGALDPAARAGCASARGRSIRRGGPGRRRAAPRRTTWNGSKQISASGTAARMARLVARRSCRSRPPGSTAGGRRARRRRPARWRCCGPGAHHTIAPVAVVGDRWSGSADGGGS